jgi:hypothetical protein
MCYVFFSQRSAEQRNWYLLPFHIEKKEERRGEERRGEEAGGEPARHVMRDA